MINLVVLSPGALCAGGLALLCIGATIGLFIAALLSANK